MEIWKDIKGYEGLYQISSLGRVNSLSRLTNSSNRLLSEKTLKPTTNRKGYLQISLSKDGYKRKTITIHQLVAIAFLNHTQCGMKTVVDHIDTNKKNNNIENLQLITNRENISKEKRGTSKYTGVSWSKIMYKWRADIYFNGKLRYLGCFTNEIDAYDAYQKELKKTT